MASLFYFIEIGKLQNVINGKHYNNAMRIYKILYFAITRSRIQSFEDWLRNEGCEKLMEDFCISKELNVFLEEVSINNNEKKKFNAAF